MAAMLRAPGLRAILALLLAVTLALVPAASANVILTRLPTSSLTTCTAPTSPEKDCVYTCTTTLDFSAISATISSTSSAGVISGASPYGIFSSHTVARGQCNCGSFAMTTGSGTTLANTAVGYFVVDVTSTTVQTSYSGSPAFQSNSKAVGSARYAPLTGTNSCLGTSAACVVETATVTGAASVGYSNRITITYTYSTGSVNAGKVCSSDYTIWAGSGTILTTSGAAPAVAPFSMLLSAALGVLLLAAAL